MKQNVMLTVTSLLSILLMSLHLTDDIVHGIEPGTARNLGTVPILLVWLYGTLMLPERRLGTVITLLGSIFASVMPVLHMIGKGVGGEFAKSSGAFFFIWTITMLGVTGSFGVILSARALWSLRKGQVPVVQQPEDAKAQRTADVIGADPVGFASMFSEGTRRR
jgi:hypothetical protein